MRILISEHELGDGATREDAGAVVAALRRAGVDAFTTDRRPGDLNADAGERPLAWLEEAAAAAQRARAALAGEDLAALPELDLVNEVIVARVAGFPPLRRAAGVWRVLDLETRTAVIAAYHEQCQKSKWNREHEAMLAAQTADCSPRLARLVGLVIDALPLDDRLRLQQRGVRFVEGDGRWAALGANGVAAGDVITIETAGRSDKTILATICHEVLHVVRDHTALLSLAESDEEFGALTAVFDRQAYALTKSLAYDALPEELAIA